MRPPRWAETEEQPGEEVGLELVLAGLAGEDDHEGETQLVKDGFLDGQGDATLVGTQVDAAGGGPADGITADGVTDAEGEMGKGERIEHGGLLWFQINRIIGKLALPDRQSDRGGALRLEVSVRSARSGLPINGNTVRCVA